MFDKNKLEKISNLVISNDFSGVVSIRTNNKKIIEIAGGYLDRANKLKNQVDTRFAIASGTKLFTSLGIMRLIEEGKLDLDDKVFDYLPNMFQTYNKDITIKHLLTHTSGIPDYFDEEAIKKTGELKLSIPWYELKKPSDYLAIMPQEDMRFLPGKDFSYNNSAFVFLAIIIEKLTGNYYTWIENEILKKASMKSSGFYMLDRLPGNCAYGYLGTDKTQLMTNIYKMPIISGGDGGMYTNVEDMFLFWESLHNGKIIKLTTLEVVLFPHYKSENMSYGLGVWLEKKKNDYLPVLFGEDPGVSFESGHNRTTGVTYTIISNTTGDAWKVSTLL